jgi:hypothetical protein
VVRGAATHDVTKRGLTAAFFLAIDNVDFLAFKHIAIAAGQRRKCQIGDPSNGSETLSRIQSLADYTIAMLESSFRKRQSTANRTPAKSDCSIIVFGSTTLTGPNTFTYGGLGVCQGFWRERRWGILDAP